MKTYEQLMAEASKIGVIEKPTKNTIPTRQLCKRCMKYSGLAFRTPDETWMAVTDDRYQHLCLPCFVDMADERMINWEPGLLIYGESMAHLIERQQRVARGEYKDEGLTEWGEVSKLEGQLKEQSRLSELVSSDLQEAKKLLRNIQLEAIGVGDYSISPESHELIDSLLTPETCNHPATDKGPSGDIYCVVCLKSLEILQPEKTDLQKQVFTNANAEATTSTPQPTNRISHEPKR